MARLLKIGETINSGTDSIRIISFLGAGAQGEVYEADYRGKRLALKWYFEQMASAEQLANLEYLISIGSPSPLFLWPQKIVKINGRKGFGYLMNKRSERYYSIVDLMKRRAEPRFEVLVKAAIEMVSGYYILHKKSLCYQDISFGNLFFDAITGEALICDNDNIVPENSVSQNVLGTPRFMAPEIVRGESKPDIKTDLFSLAVLLFYIFMIHHPLEGKLEAEIKCFDLPAMTRLYGTNPVFIYDPLNRSNRPVRNLHDNAIAFWQIYPRFFQNVFIKAFTSGLKREGRIDESQWLKTLIELSYSIYTCDCGAENFYDALKLKTSNLRCWNCSKQTQLPPRMKIGERIMVLDKNKILYDYQFKPQALIKAPEKKARVLYDKGQSTYYLENLSSEQWQVNALGNDKIVAKSQKIALKNGMNINFAGINALVRL